MNPRPRFVPANPAESRLFDLLYERAFRPLSDEERHELDRLAAKSPDVDFDCYDRAAARIDLCARAGRVSSMPSDVRAKIAARLRGLARE